MSTAALMQNHTLSQNAALPNMSPAEFDYTFTDKELQDILGFMELQQHGGQEPATTTPPFLPASAPNGLGLQFQPHPPPVQSGSTVAQPYDQNNFVGMKGEAVSSSAYSSGFGAVNGVPLVMGHPGTRSSSFAQAPAPAPLPDKRPSFAPAHSFGTKVDREPKQHVSHSTVEKQRRDRINSLIDELRDLVPPQPLSSQQEGLDNKRPKHVVLSDTIALVKELQDKARLGEVNQPGPIKQEDEAQDLMRRSYAENSASRSSDQSGSPRTNSGPDLPLAPEGAPVSSGVVVEQGEACLYVKVNCRDRRGLLGDIILALKSMPLEITTAAITTTQDGNVYDVFQVKLDAEHSNWSAQEVQCQVHSNLYTNFAIGPGDKRRRMIEA